MTLIDAERAEALYAKMGPGIESSGGSAGNTMAGIASLGGRGGLYRQGARRLLGERLPPRHDRRSGSLRYRGRDRGPGTARCLILVTPDGQRTMGTYLGACVDLGPEDIDPSADRRRQGNLLSKAICSIRRARKQAFRAAAAIAHAAGRRVALSLSDPFCVGRHRAEFLELVWARSISCSPTRWRSARSTRLTISPSGGGGARSCRDRRADPQRAGQRDPGRREAHTIGAAPVERVVDTTGAGDLYAAGMLFGLTRGLPLPTCGAVGSLCAAEIISHVGARPEAALHEIVAAAGVI